MGLREWMLHNWNSFHLCFKLHYEYFSVCLCLKCVQGYFIYKNGLNESAWPTKKGSKWLGSILEMNFAFHLFFYQNSCLPEGYLAPSSRKIWTEAGVEVAFFTRFLWWPHGTKHFFLSAVEKYSFSGILQLI